MKLDRRSFLKGSAAVATGIAINGMPVFVNTAQAAQSITGVSYLTPTYKALMYGINGFVKQLKKAGGDAIDVKFYGSGTLVSADQQVSALRSGAIQFMFHTSAYISRAFPILGITGLPMLVEALYEHGDRLDIGTPLFDLMNEQLAKNNLYMMTAGGGVMQPEYLWSRNFELKDVGDLDGKRVRVVGFEASEVLQHFGAAPTRIPSSEVYLALQRGTVDIMVGNISTILGRKLEEQLKYCYKLPISAWTEGAYMLKSHWDKLDPTVRKAFEVASKWCDANYARTVNNDIYPNEYWPRIKKAEIKIVDPSKDSMNKFSEAAQVVWGKWKSSVGDDVGQKAIDLALGKG